MWLPIYENRNVCGSWNIDQTQLEFEIHVQSSSYFLAEKYIKFFPHIAYSISIWRNIRSYLIPTGAIFFICM